MKPRVVTKVLVVPAAHTALPQRGQLRHPTPALRAQLGPGDRGGCAPEPPVPQSLLCTGCSLGWAQPLCPVGAAEWDIVGHCKTEPKGW